MKKYLLILLVVFIFGCDVKQNTQPNTSTIQEHNSIGDPIKYRPKVYCNEFGAMYYRYGDTLTPMFNKHSDIVTCDDYLRKMNQK